MQVVSIPISGNTSIKSNQMTYVDAVNGDDTTGIVDDITNPFKTIQAAVAATELAYTESSVWVRNGNYFETVAYKNNLKLILEPDVYITDTNSNTYLFIADATRRPNLVIEGIGIRNAQLVNSSFATPSYIFNRLGKKNIRNINLIANVGYICSSINASSIDRGIIEDCNIESYDLYTFANGFSGIVKNCSIKNMGGELLESSAFGGYFENTKIYCDVGGIISRFEEVADTIFKDCYIETMTRSFFCYGGLKFLGNCKIKVNTTGIAQAIYIRSSSGADTSYALEIDNLTVIQDPLNTTYPVYGYQSKTNMLLKGNLITTNALYNNPTNYPAAGVTISSVVAGDTIEIRLPSSSYTNGRYGVAYSPITYTVQAGDTPTIVRDNLAFLINSKIGTGDAWDLWLGSNPLNVIPLNTNQLQWRLDDYAYQVQGGLWTSIDLFLVTGTSTVTRMNTQGIGVWNISKSGNIIEDRYIARHNIIPQEKL